MHYVPNLAYRNSLLTIQKVQISTNSPFFSTIMTSITNRKSVLITGCSDGGIGGALAAEFQARGLYVFATARNPKKMASLEKLPNVEFLALDVESKESIAAVVSAVTEATGGKLDYLVNNSGSQVVMPILDTDIEKARQMYDVNVWGAVAIIQAFSPLIIAAKGAIINMTSITALAWPPYMGK